MRAPGARKSATATGNYSAEHEGTSVFFVKLTLVGTLSLCSLMVALAIGGVNGHWAIFTVATLAIIAATAIGLASEKGKPGLIGGLLALLVLLLIVTS